MVIYKVFVNIFFISLLSLLPRAADAAFDFNTNCQQAMKAILDLRFRDAGRMIEEEKKLRPQNGYSIYLAHYAEAIELIITEEQGLYDHLLDQLPGRMKQMDRLDDGSPDNQWLQAEMLFHAGLAQVKFGTRINGVSKMFSAYNKIRDHRRKHPGFWQNQKLTGIYNIMLDNIPPFLRWSADIFGYGGDTSIGLYQLEEYTQKAKFFPGLAEEAALITSLGYKMAGKESEGFHFISEFNHNIPDNTLVKYLYASSAIYNYRNDLALKLLSEIRENELQVKFYSLHYLTGKCKLNHLQEDANIHLEKYLKDYPGLDYKKDVCNRLSYYYLIRGDEERAGYYRSLITTAGQELRDRDQEAVLELNTGIRPHVSLLKARLLCDGGYFAEAMKVMETIEPENLGLAAYQLEYHYRLGRILQLTGETRDAISELNKAYEDGKYEPYTYATRAALQLARIFEQKQDYAQAYRWYQRCLASFSSLHTTGGVKADAGKGVKRLKGKI